MQVAITASKGKEVVFDSVVSEDAVATLILNASGNNVRKTILLMDKVRGGDATKVRAKFNGADVDVLFKRVNNTTLING